jgi:transcriptional regulator with XRE-family HTH domain
LKANSYENPKNRKKKMQDIAARLKILRRRLKLTQADMAARIGVSHSLYSKLEVGGHKLRPALAETICRNFAVPENWLLEGEGALPDEILTDLPSDKDTQPGVGHLEDIVRLAQNPQYRELAQQIADTMQIPFHRALALIIHEKLTHPS